LICALWLAGAGSVGCEKSRPQRGLLILVTFDSGVEIDQLTFSGDWTNGRLFGPETLPDPVNGLLSSEGESVGVALPTVTVGEWVDVVVVGLRNGEAVASGQQSVQVIEGLVVTVVIALQPLQGCGDGVVEAPPEACDDGNNTSGDGCSGACQVESGYNCTGQPSFCQAVTCPDADSDGVCDADDVCPGSDDALDADGDGVPDGCDPCSLDGPNAAAIPLPAAGSGITITSASINGGGNVALLNAGASFTLALDFEITDCGCPTCRDQIEVGYVPGTDPVYCAYDGVPGCGGDSGFDQSVLTAPTAPGEYILRFGLRQDFGCGAGWWHGEPPPERTLGAICVQ